MSSVRHFAFRLDCQQPSQKKEGGGAVIPALHPVSPLNRRIFPCLFGLFISP